LADTYQSRYVLTKELADLERTLTYYEQAYNIDPSLAGTNAGLGWAHYFKEKNDIAYQYFKKAHELAPKDPSVNYNIGSFFRSIGLPGKAIKYYSNAIDFGDPLGDPNPTQMSYHLRALCYEDMGKIKQAVEDSKKMLDLQPDSPKAKLYYARALIMAKNFQDAEKEISSVEKVSPDLPQAKYTRAFIAAYKGEKEKALKLIEGAEKDPYTYTYLLSRVFAVLGMKDEAIEFIKLGIERGFQEVRDYLYAYPFLANCYYLNPIRDDPRFIQILRQQKKKYDDNMKKYGDL
jgi:tetratricopeptide (TPR) repeat protein